MLNVKVYGIKIGKRLNKYGGLEGLPGESLFSLREHGHTA